MLYLTGVSTPEARSSSHPRLGALCTPQNRVARDLEHFPRHAYDNGCFTLGDRFDADAWLAWLAELPRSGLFAAVPDRVSDTPATLARFEQYAGAVRTLGHPVALVTQDGMTPADVPWPELEAVFIGGSDEHKDGPEAAELARAARALGLWVHVGRVNTLRRWRHWYGRADSADGTLLKFGPAANWPRLLRMIDWTPPAELPLEAA